ncbi:hypothetical protein EAO69_17180 [Streptomyces sp. me109]|nr:hypothetical protein EAO69_17180 [Streptomyces sp. me109]
MAKCPWWAARAREGDDHRPAEHRFAGAAAAPGPASPGRWPRAGPTPWARGGPAGRSPCGPRERAGQGARLRALTVRRRWRGCFSVPYKSPRSTVMGKGAVARTVPVNISPSL